MPSQTSDPSYPLPGNERARLQSLRDYDILDTPREEPFDGLARLVADRFEADIVLISLMDDDRQWFKSAYGMEADQTARECAFCNYTIVEEGLFVVEDALEDERFVDNALVTEEPHIRFYAGYPLSSKDNLPIGTLCVIDREPRDFSDEDGESLRNFATQAESLLELHLKTKNLEERNRELEETQERLRETIQEKESLLDEVHHRVKNNLQSIMSFLRLQSREVDGSSAQHVLAESEQRVRSIMLIHERLHQVGNETTVDFVDYCRDLISSLFGAYSDPDQRIENELDVTLETLDVQYVVPLGLFVTEATMNALEHAFEGQEEGMVRIDCHRSDGRIQLTVTDDGSGLPKSPESLQEESFGMRLMRTLGVDQLGGDLEYESDGGTTVKLTVPLDE